MSGGIRSGCRAILGIIWPAFAIAVAVLLARLPTRPLRFAAVGFLVLVNLAQFSARVHQSEPPTDLLAADMLKSGATRTYLFGGIAEGFGAKPGEGSFQSPAWHYYMIELSAAHISPEDFRLNRQWFINQFKPSLTNRPAMIAVDANVSPQLKHLIVWDKIERFGIDTNRIDAVKAALGPQWHEAGEQVYTAFDHWTWQKLYQLRRREYVRM